MQQNKNSIMHQIAQIMLNHFCVKHLAQLVMWQKQITIYVLTLVCKRTEL